MPQAKKRSSRQKNPPMTHLIDAMNTAVMLVDKDLVITYMNEGSKKIFIENKDDFCQQYPNFDFNNVLGTCIDIFHKNPEHQRHLLADPKNLPYKAEIRVSKLCFFLFISALYDESGDHTGCILEWVNCTEEKNKLADASSRLSAIDKANAVIEFTTDGKVITANENFLSMAGYTLNEVVGQHHHLFLDDEHANSRDYQFFWQKIMEGEHESGEYHYLKKSGQSLWLQASYSPVFDMSGNVIKIIKYATDISEEKIKRADHYGQIQAINRSSAVIEFNTDGTIITANQNFLSLTGYSLDEIINKHHRIFVDDTYQVSEDYKMFWENLNRGEYNSGEYQRLTKKGDSIWIQASYNPVFDINGRLVKVVKYATDITARKKSAALIKETLIKISQGDLSTTINGDVEEEFIIVAEAINELINKFEALIQQIHAISDNIFSTARGLLASNQDLSKRTENQAASLEETAAAMEELSSTVQKNAENASDSSEMANEAMEKARKGGEAVKATISAMGDINKSSKKIADIISVIDEIAFQTNLLALNAAVEAARAGEQGRGFAVVASEVRNLAQRSASAAKEIKGLISDSVDAVSQGSKLVDNSGETFSELVTSVERVVAMMGDISLASKEQSIGISEISEAINQMDEVTQQNSIMVDEAANASQEMEDQANLLINQMSLFKISK